MLAVSCAEAEILPASSVVFLSLCLVKVAFPRGWIGERVGKGGERRVAREIPHGTAGPHEVVESTKKFGSFHRSYSVP